ncbi:MAG: hypothetical protein DRP75_01850 [Candidatus Omnitrophota bacterium]|nr:MAG: hypothetical protein DRP75_01850 [Candidatus Omnitrophota bacterium]
MLCDICQKNIASVHITEIVNEKMVELHLCEQCAQEKGIGLSEDFSLANFLAGLTDFDLPRVKESVELQCPNCGMSYEDFKKIGRLGCSQCYYTFKQSLAPLLKRIQGAEQHIGKFPHYADKGMREKVEIEELQRELSKAIQEENFEQAAKLRDKIREIKSKMKKSEE